MYSFYTEMSYGEIVDYLDQTTNELRRFGLANGMCSKINGQMIFLQEGKNMKHPLQRVFKGEIEETDDGSVIKGKFHYPVTALIFYIFSFLFLLSKNIEAVFKIDLLKEKILVSLIFLVIYIGIAFILVTARLSYEEQERDVIDFLESM